MGMIGPYQQTGMNVYDQRIKCKVPGLCYDFSGASAWLNFAEVQKALGVSKKWESCNYAVNAQFSGDWMQRYDTMIPDMLASGIRVLIYAGDCDFICDWLLVHASISGWPYGTDGSTRGCSPHAQSVHHEHLRSKRRGSDRLRRNLVISLMGCGFDLCGSNE